MSLSENELKDIKREALKQTLEDLKNEKDKKKEELDILSGKILELLKGADTISVIPNILANIFESLEYDDTTDLSFDNQRMDWGIDHYITRKVKASMPKVKALYNYCVDEGHTMEDKFEFGGGDREVCYIPTPDATDNEKKKFVLYFQNQNIKFVVVLIDDYYPKMHIREVYTNIFDKEEEGNLYFYNGETSCDSVDELREALKLPNGLETAMLNLGGYSDVIKGNSYPKRIDLKSMINANFGEKTPAFRYGDCRDAGYLISYKDFGRTETNNLSRARYAFNDVAYAIEQVPESYFLVEQRDNKLEELLNIHNF